MSEIHPTKILPQMAMKALRQTSSFAHTEIAMKTGNLDRQTTML
jgi:hypothetical protein